jgi:hypothetical protein
VLKAVSAAICIHNRSSAAALTVVSIHCIVYCYAASCMRNLVGSAYLVDKADDSAAEETSAVTCAHSNVKHNAPICLKHICTEQFVKEVSRCSKISAILKQAYQAMCAQDTHREHTAAV